MIIYKDAVSRDELFSDGFPVEELPALYSVTARTVVKDLAAGVDIGATGDGEPEEAGESETVEVINLVDLHRLRETSLDRRGFAGHLKRYFEAVEDRLEANAPDQVAAFRKDGQEAAEAIVGDFDSYTFYQGESRTEKGMVIMARPAGDDDTWTFTFWKHGTHAEKC